MYVVDNTKIVTIISKPNLFHYKIKALPATDGFE